MNQLVTELAWYLMGTSGFLFSYFATVMIACGSMVDTPHLLFQTSLDV
jgi:hypothetical protein